jgi:hypothetical protein
MSRHNFSSCDFLDTTHKNEARNKKTKGGRKMKQMKQMKREIEKEKVHCN